MKPKKSFRKMKGKKKKKKIKNPESENKKQINVETK